ncbi:hypothetical protein [Marinobacter salsuginis]|uniref:Uncharacterized protein n=1 Tax=Marinobacter salsuginis TaxID=418719 RepID=A0A5M3Q659_9GAMM|nr:hypothetical protein [Marinobacter salsuginis]GBO90210.1 hypothetical protein MSSD14B_38780 [Marinobacter salsuginis]
MNFTRPPKNLSVNGFPITFREIALNSGRRLWVPRGISRNEEAGCWRIYVVSEDDIFTRYVHDQDYEGEPEASLKASFELMKAFLQGSTSRFIVDQRARSPGGERDPMTDCGVTGVMISRSSYQGYKKVVVTSHYAYQQPDGDLQRTQYYAGSISERSEQSNLVSLQTVLLQHLRKAIDVRRHYNRLRSQGIHPQKPLSHDDVPADIRAMPATIPEHIDVAEILDSYMATPWKPRVRTTGGDPELLAARLQQHDLTHPHKLVYLNGFSLRLRKRHCEGQTLYLPKEIYRARGEWRIRLFHADGIFTDSVTDDECQGSIEESLRQAWLYLISEIRQSSAYSEAQNFRPARNPLLETGIRAVNLLIFFASGGGKRQPRWRVSLGMVQDEGGERMRRTLIRTWTLSTVTDEKLSEALRHGAAMSAFRYHLLNAGIPPEEAVVRKDTAIPEEFWPSTPPCPVSADDLKYFVEQQEYSAA